MRKQVKKPKSKEEVLRQPLFGNQNIQDGGDQPLSLAGGQRWLSWIRHGVWKLTGVEFDAWARKFRNAGAEINGREEKLMFIADSIERDLVLLGVTAVEDKLQDGVPEAVKKLRQAGLKIWLLTGDKLETAVSIALSSNVLRSSVHLFLITDDLANDANKLLQGMLHEAQAKVAAHAKLPPDEASKKKEMAIIIEGASLDVALEDRNKLVFLELCMHCRTVICCRATPMQKYQVVTLVREHAKAVSLAVGDGASDVAMIRAANIGVGITGYKGNTAVLASDFSLAQFCHLTRLLLVHGRWSYKRNRELIFYVLYKNVVYTLGNLFLACVSGFSAQPLFPTVLMCTYDLLWTFFPPLLQAGFDQDVPAHMVESNPALYKETQNEAASIFYSSFLGWMIAATWHAFIIFFALVKILDNPQPDGQINGFDFISISIYILLVVVVNVKLALRINLWHWFTHAAVWVESIILLMVLVALLSSTPQDKIAQAFSELSGYYSQALENTSVWLALILVPVLACLIDYLFFTFLRLFRPSLFQVLQEVDHGWRNGKFVGLVDHGSASGHLKGEGKAKEVGRQRRRSGASADDRTDAAQNRKELSCTEGDVHHKELSPEDTAEHSRSSLMRRVHKTPSASRKSVTEEAIAQHGDSPSQQEDDQDGDGIQDNKKTLKKSLRHSMSLPPAIRRLKLQDRPRADSTDSQYDTSDHDPNLPHVTWRELPQVRDGVLQVGERRYSMGFVTCTRKQP
ncbi:hypothetical protein CBR_g26338 [Chara braunii]|uniref:Phospholipid-transporting ATPase n=1 Tax=Chara braunii TaxID=69332 RepID=A0A388L7Q6_CHABU|nr:hypothetical protein CBR_g26338 [Chara braunii]|eukprot:GBG78308.1 hypothetical protein CBR_g26338 [Chara braunii]